MKVDIDALAEKAARFGGLRDSQIGGLAVLFRMVEREAFCEGIRAGRTSSYATDPAEVYERGYASKAATSTNSQANTQTRKARRAATRAPVRTNGQHREEAASVAQIEVNPDPDAVARTVGDTTT